jgi:hypothetical protein
VRVLEKRGMKRRRLSDCVSVSLRGLSCVVFVLRRVLVVEWRGEERSFFQQHESDSVFVRKMRVEKRRSSVLFTCVRVQAHQQLEDSFSPEW